MRLYARTPGKFSRQLAWDLAFIAWIVLWWKFSAALERHISSLATPARQAADALTTVQTNVAKAADGVGKIPWVGEEVRAPFDHLDGDVGALVLSSEQQAQAAEQAGHIIGWLVFAIPVGIAALIWLTWRLRYLRSTHLIARVGQQSGGLELLAWRAVATVPLTELAARPGVVAALQERDPLAVWTLAHLYCKDVGYGRLPAHLQPNATVAR